MSAIIQAIRALDATLGESGNLSTALETQATGEQAKTVKHLCFGVLRYYYELSALVNIVLEKKLKDKNRDLRLLLMIGFFQLRYTDQPPPAIVDHCVTTSDLLKKTWSKALINRTLREYLRSPERYNKVLSLHVTSVHNHPKWLIKRIHNAWPNHWSEILSANQKRPPLVIRVNNQLIDTVSYVNKHIKGCAMMSYPALSSGLVVSEPCPVKEIPGFSEGLCSVQDGAAQLAAEFLRAGAQDHILDACAAPGGKTCHILERYPGCHLDALDIMPSRLTRIEENIQRLHLGSSRIRLASCDVTGALPFDCLYDRILLDAPCSGTGVIRRHPDIKVCRKAGDLVEIKACQRALLARLWSALKPGGYLLYATCSVLPEENDDQIMHWLVTSTDARIIPLYHPWGIRTACGLQFLPQDGGFDGFYYALVRRLPSP